MTVTVKTAVQEITPAKADELLKKNGRNRKMRQNVVRRYAADMAAGKWELNGEPILFNGDGSLLNGQHRLHACIEANVPFTTVVVSGIESDAMQTIDTGTSRTFADYLTIKDVTHAAIIASTVSWGMRYDTMIETGALQLVGHDARRSAQIEYLDAHRDLLLHSTELVSAHSRLLIGRPGIFAFAHFIASRDGEVSVRKVDDFIIYATDPAGLAATEGPTLIRNAMLRIQATTHVRGKQSSVAQAALTVKAIRLWIRDQETTMLKWSRGSGRKGSKATKEAFPRI